MTTRVRVNPRFSVCYQTRRYNEGETLDVDDDAAAGGTAWGSVQHVPHEKLRSRKGS